MKQLRVFPGQRLPTCKQETQEYGGGQNRVLGYISWNQLVIILTMSVKEQSAIFPDGKLILLQGRDQRLSEKVLFPLQEGSLRINYDLTNRGA